MLQSLTVDDRVMGPPAWLRTLHFGPKDLWPMDLESPPKLEHLTILSCSLRADDRDLDMTEFFAQYGKGLKSLTVQVPNSALLNNEEWCSDLE